MKKEVLVDSEMAILRASLIPAETPGEGFWEKAARDTIAGALHYVVGIPGDAATGKAACGQTLKEA